MSFGLAEPLVASRGRDLPLLSQSIFRGSPRDAVCARMRRVGDTGGPATVTRLAAGETESGRRVRRRDLRSCFRRPLPCSPACGCLCPMPAARSPTAARLLRSLQVFDRVASNTCIEVAPGVDVGRVDEVPALVEEFGDDPLRGLDRIGASPHRDGKMQSWLRSARHSRSTRTS